MRCLVRRCKRHPVAANRCRTHAKKAADRAWTAAIRTRGACELAELHPFPCAGRLQAAHGFSRRYLGTRYLLTNGFALCAAAHIYWTYRPLEWDDVLRRRWGTLTYRRLRRLAVTFTGPVDYAGVLASLARAEGARAA